MGKIFSCYLQGNWLRLADLLKNEIQHYAIMGDSVKLTILLSQYGCCHLYLGNHHEVYNVYQFFNKDPLKDESFTIEEWASVTRFFALYALVNGKIDEASQFYDQSFEAFQLINEVEAETMLLVEAYRWMYCLVDDQERRQYIVDRLQTINSSVVESHVFHYIQTSEKVDFVAEFREYILFYSTKDEYPPLFFSQFLKLLESMRIRDKENCLETIYKLLATTTQIKYSIYRAWSNYFAWCILDEDGYLDNAISLFRSLNLTKMVHACLESQSKGNAEVSDRVESQISHRSHKDSNKLSFTLFKEFTVKWNDIIIHPDKWERKKAEEILLFLLMQSNLQVDKELVIEEFYPDDDYKKAGNRLYVIVHTINKKLSEWFLTNEPILSLKGGRLLLNHNLIDEVDVQSYLKLYSVGKQLWFADRESAVELFEKARKIFDHQFVNHVLYVPAINQFRNSLNGKQIDLLQKLFSHYHDTSIKEELLQELLDCDPFNEDIIKENILFLHEQGRHFEARQFYKKQRELFKDELGYEFTFDMDVVR